MKDLHSKDGMCGTIRLFHFMCNLLISNLILKLLLIFVGIGSNLILKLWLIFIGIDLKKSKCPQTILIKNTMKSLNKFEQEMPMLIKKT